MKSIVDNDLNDLLDILDSECLLLISQLFENNTLELAELAELVEFLNNNELARARLTEIVDNHLENEFNFDSLMLHLSKKEKKTLINV